MFDMKKRVQHATICFLIKGDKVLLGMKKRGFGVGWWNGIGGKAEDNESIEEAAKREAREEIQVELDSLEKVAELHFYFVGKNEKDWLGHVFLVTKWKGRPKETEEMKPKWFKKKEIPYNKMWDADHLWIPKVLKGEKLKAKIGFNKNDKLIKHEIATKTISF